MARPCTPALTRSLSFVASRFLLLLGLFVGACAPDESLTGSGTRAPLGNGANVIGDADLALLIEADLTCLYDKAGLLPNAQSSLGKFNTIKSQIAAGDIDGAISATQNLIAFIELKYSQYANQSALIPCVTGEIGITELKERVVTRLYEFLGLTGTICEVPAGSGGKYCKTADNQTAMVYFPPGIFDKLTFVSLEENPAGFTQLQTLGLDEYPNYVRINTLPITDFKLEPLKPLVVVCFNPDVTPLDAALRARMLLGHRHTDENNVVSFKLLPEPDFNAYGSDVQAQVALFCSSSGASTQVAPFSERTLLGRVGNRVANFLAPAPLQARTAFGIGGGVGGSAEEFSEFGAVDPGLNGKGGIGGSAEEFIRTGRPMAALTSTDPSLVVGEAGENAMVDGNRLPKVRVVSPAAAEGATPTPIQGVEVTFEIIPAATFTDQSEASLCGLPAGVTKFVVLTNASGEARPPCINFGNDLGFRKLKVTFDPTKQVDVLACMLNTDGYCATATFSKEFLLKTVAGGPAKLGLVGTPPGATSAQAGVAMVPQPELQVQDAFGNPVTGLAVGTDYPINLSVATPVGATVSPQLVGVATSNLNLATGRITFSGLALGGVVGTPYTLTFASAPLISATDTVSVTAPGAASAITTANPANGNFGTGLSLATPLAPKVLVTDRWGNAVGGALVRWQLQTAMWGATVSPSSNETDAISGLASTSWKLGDGDNGLRAYLGSTSGPFAQFLAESATGGVSLSCLASGSLRKLDMGGYTNGQYTGYFSMKPELTARFRSLRLQMSATGQSSFGGTYPATVEIYRNSTSGTLLGRGTPVGGGISIPGDNGSAVSVEFVISPEADASVAALGNNDMVVFKLVVTAPSNRTLQLWYNARPPAGTCNSSLLYQPGFTNFAGATSRDFVRGLLIRVSN